ncbi:MAG: AtpZ/AtpI family protein [Flavobacteriales bacterium]
MIKLKNFKQKTSKQKHNNSIKSYAQYSGIAFQMIVIICLGTYAGIKLDQKFPNKYSIGTLFLSFSSVVIAMYFVVRQVLRDTKKKQ